MMKYSAVCLCFILLLSGCNLIQKRKIDSVSYVFTEDNNSSKNIYVQYYYKADDYNERDIEGIWREAGSKHNDQYESYHSKWSWYENPNEFVDKILIMDTDSHKLLKRIDHVVDVFRLEKATDDYESGTRTECYLLDINDDLFAGDTSE